MPCPEGNFIRAVESGAAFPPHGAQVTLQCHRPGAASPCWQLPGKGGKAEEMDFSSACTGWANYTLSCVYLGKIWSTSSCLKAGRIFSVYLHRIDGFIYSPMEYFSPQCSSISQEWFQRRLNFTQAWQFSLSVYDFIIVTRSQDKVVISLLNLKCQSYSIAIGRGKKNLISGEQLTTYQLFCNSCLCMCPYQISGSRSLEVVQWQEGEKSDLFAFVSESLQPVLQDQG